MLGLFLIIQLDLSLCFFLVVGGYFALVIKSSRLASGVRRFAERVFGASKDIVIEDLELGFFPGLEAPPEFARHCETLFEMTVHRSYIVRARVEDPVSDELVALCVRCRTVFNGDLRLGRIQYFAPNGMTMSEAVQIIVELLLHIIFACLGFQKTDRLSRTTISFARSPWAHFMN